MVVVRTDSRSRRIYVDGFYSWRGAVRVNPAQVRRQRPVEDMTPRSRPQQRPRNICPRRSNKRPLLLLHARPGSAGRCEVLNSHLAAIYNGGTLIRPIFLVFDILCASYTAVTVQKWYCSRRGANKSQLTLPKNHAPPPTVAAQVTWLATSMLLPEPCRIDADIRFIGIYTSK